MFTAVGLGFGGPGRVTDGFMFVRLKRYGERTRSQQEIVQLAVPAHDRHSRRARDPDQSAEPRRRLRPPGAVRAAGRDLRPAPGRDGRDAAGGAEARLPRQHGQRPQAQQAAARGARSTATAPPNSASRCRRSAARCRRCSAGARRARSSSRTASTTSSSRSRRGPLAARPDRGHLRARPRRPRPARERGAGRGEGVAARTQPLQPRALGDAGREPRPRRDGRAGDHAISGQSPSARCHAGVRVELAGESREFAESSGGLYFLFAIALAFIFLVLAAQFESFIHPLTILLVGAARRARRAADAVRVPDVAQHLLADRAHHADRARDQERDPDRRVREPAARARRTARGGGRPRRAHPPAPDPHDHAGDHVRRAADRARPRRRRREPQAARRGGRRRHDLLDGPDARHRAGRLHDARAIRRRPEGRGGGGNPGTPPAGVVEVA